MSEEGLQCYLDGKFTNLESRLTLLEREVHQAHLHQMTAEHDKRRELRDVEIARKAVQLRDEEVDRIIGRSTR
jgi:hypothetical protein